MASAIYDKGRQKFLEGGIAWLTDSIKVVAVDNGAYTVNLSTHEFLSDIAGGARIGTTGNLANKTSTAGVADADDITITGLSGTSVESLVIYKDTGVASTSPLICYIDTASAGLPFTPNGGDVTFQWDSGSNKIFKL